MDYNEKIKEHREAIEKLQKEMQEEALLQYNNIVGKCYKPSSTSRYKVIEVHDIDDETTIHVDCISVFMNYDGDNIGIDTFYSTTINLKDEIPLIEFNEYLNKAILNLKKITNIEDL